MKMSCNKTAGYKLRLQCISLLLLLAWGCSKPTEPKKEAAVTKSMFGTTAEGTPVDLFTLTNAHGVEARIIGYGGILVSLRVPDRTGKLDDIVLGCSSQACYEKETYYFGALIGRYGNRIAAGRFALDGTPYQLATNNPPNHLHGGVKGFDKVIWAGNPFQNADGVGVTFSRQSPDGEEGYPGTLAALVTYTLTGNNELTIEYSAKTDKTTIVNLTHHSYFNLAGEGKRDILGHEMMINADRYTPIDPTSIPTGELAPVEGTPFDFRKPTTIGSRLGQDNVQLKNGRGYDHNFVLNRQSDGLMLAARVVEPGSGRVLEVSTTEPGIQFYSGNYLDGSLVGKSGQTYGEHSGFCLEPQHFPDSPNHSNFPSTVLRPGEEHHSKTVFRFSTQ